MVSHPETSSDSPIGSDRDRGRDMHDYIFACVIELKWNWHHAFHMHWGTLGR